MHGLAPAQHIRGCLTAYTACLQHTVFKYCKLNSRDAVCKILMKPQSTEAQ